MERQHTFLQLKQPCVQVLQATATLSQSPSAPRELIHALTRLLTNLQSITSTPGLLDAKLTEYAFVSLSQVLRNSRHVPVRALELCLECISTLLSANWGGGLEPALSGQLLILFTFLAKPSSAENGISATSEELQSLALGCTSELMSATSRTKQGKEAMTAAANIPALGEAVLVMLERLTDSNSNTVKLQSTCALKQTVGAIGDDDALASFLPRIVSSLAKVLTPRSSVRPGFRVVEQGLEVLASLLARLLGDAQTKDLPETLLSDESGGCTTISRSVAWLQATATQMKIALANIFRLRDHDKQEVRQALLNLCLCVVRDCRTSLSLCTSMAIETMVDLAGHETPADTTEDKLKRLLSADQNLSELLRESLHGWIVALPRLMRSKHDRTRHKIVHQISVSLRLFDEDPMILDERLADSLRDGVSAVFIHGRGLEEINDRNASLVAGRTLVFSSTESSSFPLISMQFKGQEDMMKGFKVLVQELARSNSALAVAQGLTNSVDLGAPEMRLASFWLSVNLVRDMASVNPSVDDFMNLGTPNPREEVLDDLYSHSLSLLNQRTVDTNSHWHLYALALETVALQAKRYKTEFRPELSEVLYPVLHYLGSSNSALREHALICLNIVAGASGYKDAGELVVSNVDYIVNAIGLKLAYGDVSPQAPQVLLMMIRLCGPPLLPYLDDLVDSIFNALERYHGYPKLVELLFNVLKGMTEQGVKAPQLAVSADNKKEEHVHLKRTVVMNDVIEAIQKFEVETQEREEEEKQASREALPRKPWKVGKTSEDTDSNSTDEENGRPPPPHTEESSPPAPRAFAILLKISELTQHYLTTMSPNLRNSLLSLLRTTIPAIAAHENSLLPLINTLWPVLLPRLQDSEAYVVSNALDIVALMCEHGKDFMRTRIDDAWNITRKVYERTRQNDDCNRKGSFQPMSLEIKAIGTGLTRLAVDSQPTADSSPMELYVDTPTRMIWNSLTALLCAIAKNVTMRDERFEEMLDMLDPVLARDDVRGALGHSNADAIWLRLYKKRQGTDRGKHSRSFVSTKAHEVAGKIPVGKPHWHFVRA